VFDLVASIVVRKTTIQALQEEPQAPGDPVSESLTFFEERLFMVTEFDLLDMESLRLFTASCSAFGSENMRAPRRLSACVFYPVALARKMGKGVLDFVRSQEPLFDVHNTVTFPIVIRVSSGRLCHFRFEDVTGEDCIWDPIKNTLEAVFRQHAPHRRFLGSSVTVVPP
jgi:hypothetical protein